MKNAVTKPRKLSWYKEKAWQAFSTYIRTRDCLRTTLTTEKGTCCTCNREYPFKQLQAGHFIDGRLNAVLFSERGVHAQCYACNVMLHGNKLQYWLFMEQYYGRKVIDELMDESQRTVKYRALDYQEIEQKYYEKTAEVLADRSKARLLVELDMPF